MNHRWWIHLRCRLVHPCSWCRPNFCLGFFLPNFTFYFVNFFSFHTWVSLLDQKAPYQPFLQNTRRNSNGWHSDWRRKYSRNGTKNPFKEIVNFSFTWKSGWISQERFWTLSWRRRGRPSILFNDIFGNIFDVAWWYLVRRDKPSILLVIFGGDILWCLANLLIFNIDKNVGHL